jgi:hypothetical protein
MFCAHHLFFLDTLKLVNVILNNISWSSQTNIWLTHYLVTLDSSGGKS